jgi:hypothetical protein
MELVEDQQIISSPEKKETLKVDDLIDKIGELSGEKKRKKRGNNPEQEEEKKSEIEMSIEPS